MYFHVTRTNLGKVFKAKTSTCVAPSIEQAILGLFELLSEKINSKDDYKKKHPGNLWIYITFNKPYRKGKEFDSYLTGEKLVKKNASFIMCAKLKWDTLKYFEYYLYCLSNSRNQLTRTDWAQLHKLYQKIINDSLLKELIFI